MFTSMKGWVIIVNIFTLAWFIFLQYYRYHEGGKTCSGDYYLGYADNQFDDEYFKRGFNEDVFQTPTTSTNSTAPPPSASNKVNQPPNKLYIFE